MKPFYAFSHRDESNQLHWQGVNQDRPHCDATWFWGRAAYRWQCATCGGDLDERGHCPKGCM